MRRAKSRRIVEWIFPGTYEEYLEAREIHRREIKNYRKNPQFIVGFVLFMMPLLLIIILVLVDSLPMRWLVLALSIAIGEMLVRDTISEHYCFLLNQEEKKQSSQASDAPAG